MFDFFGRRRPAPFQQPPRFSPPGVGQIDFRTYGQVHTQSYGGPVQIPQRTLDLLMRIFGKLPSRGTEKVKESHGRGLGLLKKVR